MKSAERIERIALLKRQAELMKQHIVSGDKTQLGRYSELLQEITKLTRIEAGFQDIMTFCKNYLTAEAPHDLLKADTPSPPFHYDLARYLREATIDPRERKFAIAAPRSHAKSTIISNAFILWCICYVEDLEKRYWLLIADKQDNGRRFLDVIKNELEGNPLLREDFGDLKGPTWNSLEIVTKNQVKVQAAGAGEGLRGLRYGSERPNVVCDDIESDESTSTPERIEKLYSWLLRTVAPLGDPKRMKFYIIGTVISYGSVLNTLLNEHGDFDSYRYQAIEKFPERMDMWNEFERIYHSRDEGDSPMDASRIARQKALDYYTENHVEMNEGAKVLWPERMDLLSLMIIRATNRLAFGSEYQNDPLDSSTQIFHKIWTYTPDEINIDELDIFGACDPSLGKTKRSDPSVILTLGRHPKTGILYVLDVDRKRRKPDQIIQDIFAKAQIYNYSNFCVETIAFQEMFKDEIIKRSAEQGIYLPVREYKSTVKKEVRISALEPLVTNGQVRILTSQKDLIEEMERFPRGSHDDMLDGLNMAVDLARKRSSGLKFTHI
jgi:predicted phage terminase large subunit-like protein